MDTPPGGQRPLVAPPVGVVTRPLEVVIRSPREESVPDGRPRSVRCGSGRYGAAALQNGAVCCLCYIAVMMRLRCVAEYVAIKPLCQSMLRCHFSSGRVVPLLWIRLPPSDATLVCLEWYHHQDSHGPSLRLICLRTCAAREESSFNSPSPILSVGSGPRALATVARQVEAGVAI